MHGLKKLICPSFLAWAGGSYSSETFGGARRAGARGWQRVIVMAANDVQEERKRRIVQQQCSVH